MRRPPDLIFGVDDKPPLTTTLFNGCQHVGVIAINLIYPLVLFKLAGTSVAATVELLSVGLLVLGIGTFLQSARRSPVGSGYMCPSTFTATYVSASIVAVRLGGLPLLFGMTMFAGVIEALVSRTLSRLRAFLPTELSGMVVFMIGITAGIAGVRTLYGAGAAPITTGEWGVAALTLAVMVALNVWGKGGAKMLCALIGLVVGYLAGAAAGLFDTAQVDSLVAAPWIGLPTFSHASLAFDWSIAIPFAVASVAAAMKAVGTIAMCQRMNDADWARPEPRSVARGVLGDGVITALSGLVGSVGTNTSTPSVGIAAATGIASRSVAYATGGIFISFGFLPKIAALLAIMPRAVMASGLLFSACFILIGGLQVMTSRLLDIRRTITIGLAIIAGASVEIFPAIAASAPRSLAPLLSSSLAFGTLIGLVLNMIFRLGVKKTVVLNVERDKIEAAAIGDFLRSSGGKWGARPEIVARASFGANQLVEAVAENCWQSGILRLEASFDEFNLDVHATYPGTLMTFPDQRPTDDEIIDLDDGMRRLAGYMLRHNADRIRSDTKGESARVWFHFDH
ncbi:MAG: solute carrier family 23 protein [Casimicrobiaceae bacterium]